VWRRKPTEEHELGRLSRGARRTVFRLWYHPGSIVNDTGEFHETFATVHGYAYGRNSVSKIEHHAIPTGYHSRDAEEHRIYPKAGVRLVLRQHLSGDSNDAEEQYPRIWGRHSEVG
jgi:hypothetical protein